MLTDDMLHKLIAVFHGLHVDKGPDGGPTSPSAGGTVMTESLMLALAARGVPPKVAHELSAVLRAPAPRGERCSSSARAPTTGIQRFFSAQEIDRFLDPKLYVQFAAAKTDRLLYVLEPTLGS